MYIDVEFLAQRRRPCRREHAILRGVFKVAQLLHNFSLSFPTPMFTYSSSQRLHYITEFPLLFHPLKILKQTQFEIVKWFPY